MAHKFRRLMVAALIGVTIAAVLTPVLVTEGALHIVTRPRPDSADADNIAWNGGATWEAARVSTSDGVLLDGWLFTPRQPSGSGVILLHGVGDTRTGMSVHATYLLRAGFTVLAPDSRGHGSSGGSPLTYGIRESRDVHVATLLQSLAREPRFRAVVAEYPFDTFEDVAHYRVE
jgi:pimeloyl-ACP methyl ester carboxylesterase